MPLELCLEAQSYAIGQWPETAPLPDFALALLQTPPAGVVSLTRTVSEWSLVCPESSLPTGDNRQGGRWSLGWRALFVVGPLAFDMVGVLAGISQVLAQAQVSLFVLSTYDNDWVLVQAPQLATAIGALQMAGYHLTPQD
jgi:hypothetical protein